SMSIVDLFEVVEIDEEHCEALVARLPASGVDTTLHQMAETVAIHQAGQFVGAKAVLHVLEAACEFAELVASADVDGDVFSSADLVCGVLEAAQIARDPAQNCKPDSGHEDDRDDA